MKRIVLILAVVLSVTIPSVGFSDDSSLECQSDGKCKAKAKYRISNHSLQLNLGYIWIKFNENIDPDTLVEEFSNSGFKRVDKYSKNKQGFYLFESLNPATTIDITESSLKNLVGINFTWV